MSISDANPIPPFEIPGRDFVKRSRSDHVPATIAR